MSSSNMRNPNPLMLLRIAQADAYCMATEYIKFPRDQAVYDAAKEFKQYVKHPTHALGAGMYTDDTQMSIAVAEQLIRGNLAAASSKQDYADRFMEAFLRDPRDGYSRGFQKILEESRTGKELVSKLIPNSTKNGAAMRSVPLGVLSNVMDVMEQATTQAAVTHDTPDGISSSQIIALLSFHAMRTDLPYKKIFEIIKLYVRGYDDIFVVPWRGPVTNRSKDGGRDVGINTVHAICTLLNEQVTLMGILNQVIEWGGDTDSVAAIAWGIASARMHEPIPGFLEECLEPGRKYGPQFLRTLGADLMEMFDAKGPA